VREELDRVLEQAEKSLAKDPATAHFLPLERTLNAVEWHNRRLDVTARAERLLNGAPPYDPGAGYTEGRYPLDYEQLGEIGRWSEVHIHAPSCRISGRMDVVEKRAGKLVIVRDYKTGRVYDDEGEVMSNIARQLRLYALAISELEPSARVSLVVSHKTDTAVPWDDERDKTKAWLARQIEGLTAHDVYPAATLANPGTTCNGCPFRYVCPAYRSAAPRLWTEGSKDIPLPLDTWGEVLKLEHAASDTITLTLRDPIGRRVKVFRLESRHEALRMATPGIGLWLFGLATQKMTLTRGRWIHPTNFEELPVVGLRRSWAAAVFLQQ
jgi:CRISPR/Cas system-associated exonuclease Cas4 (RecB family)